jgi:hypothetical protein
MHIRHLVISVSICAACAGETVGVEFHAIGNGPSGVVDAGGMGFTPIGDRIAMILDGHSFAC